MKKRIVLLMATVMMLAKGYSQINQLSISDLYTPNAPGFALADVSPSSIDKPTTPRAFGISLLNLSQGGAMEVTPFWLTNHANLTFDKYIQKKTPLLETFNLSVATFKTDTVNNVAAGFRTHIFRSYSADKIKQLQGIKNQIIQALATDPTNIDTAAISKFKQDLTDARKRGFFLVELAGALMASSPTNSYNDLASSKSGFWLNARWAPDNSALDFMGLARYTWTNNAPVKAADSSFFDYGIALSYATGKFDCELEYIARRDFSIDKSYTRFAFVANYMFSESVIAVASIGKNFMSTGNILAAFGVKFTVAKERVSLF
ncbi:MAG TPA: hypothetical protein VEB42_11745 [Chitinophagaceae bacterium]|nr:hypothetical protein [Chitinophagaceae bacterium]